MKIYGNITMQDKVRLLSTRTHKSIYKEGVKSIIPKAIALYETVRNDTGEVVKVATIIDKDGTCWDTVSPVVREMLTGLIDICESESGVVIEAINFQKETSKKGREFLVCEPVLGGDEQ